MRTIVNSIVGNIIALYLIALAIPAVGVAGGIKGYLITAFALAILNLIGRPLINLILLPINLITVGMFRWLTNTIILWLATVFVSGFTIGEWHFAGFSSQGIILEPAILNVFWTTVVTSFLFSIITAVYDWLIEK